MNRSREKTSVVIIVLFLLLATSFVYSLNIPIPADLFFSDSVKELDVSSRDYINISIYRLYIPLETSSTNETLRNITIELVLEPGGVYRINTTGRVGGEIREAGYIVIPAPPNISEINLFVVEPYLKQKIPIGVYRGEPFDTIAQTQDYSAYIIIDRVTRISIKCLLNRDTWSRIYVLELTRDNTWREINAGSCSYNNSHTENTIDLSNYLKYYLYIDLSISFLTVTFEKNRYLIYPLKNNSLFLLIFLSTIIVLGFVSYEYFLGSSRRSSVGVYRKNKKKRKRSI